MKPVNGVQEEQRPDPLIEIIAATTKGIEFGAQRMELRQRSRATNRIERPVANLRIGRGDDLNQRIGHIASFRFESAGRLLATAREQFDEAG